MSGKRRVDNQARIGWNILSVLDDDERLHSCEDSFHSRIDRERVHLNLRLPPTELDHQFCGACLVVRDSSSFAEIKFAGKRELRLANFRGEEPILCEGDTGLHFGTDDDLLNCAPAIFVPKRSGTQRLYYIIHKDI